MSTQAQLTMFSPAKINLYLRILGRRADGYHDLETVMLPLDFGDQITLQLAEKNVTLECDDPRLPTDDTNLALRAAKLLATKCRVEQGVRILLQKRTPLAAGLGGGSSNAAAVLKGLSQLWQVDAPPDVLGELAARIGSDINFFLAGGAALCRGRGEQVEPIACKLSAAILLVNPGFGISTKWAYESWAKAAAGLTAKPPEVSLLLRALAENDLLGVSRCLFNSLEAPSIKKFPVLRLLKDAMRAGGATGALMSGSGATVFGLLAGAKAAEDSAKQIREEFGPSMWTQVTKCMSV
ncbi:MAG: 4-(cytidine 5'-diphospho)-2-C-methyl-D-erythritol kinase [Verrucomicrobiia bacterium]